MSDSLGFTKTPNGNVVELYYDIDGHHTRTFVPVADSEIVLTPDQAHEYLRIMRASGGVVREGSPGVGR